MYFFSDLEEVSFLFSVSASFYRKMFLTFFSMFVWVTVLECGKCHLLSRMVSKQSIYDAIRYGQVYISVFGVFVVVTSFSNYSLPFSGTFHGQVYQTSSAIKFNSLEVFCYMGPMSVFSSFLPICNIRRYVFVSTLRTTAGDDVVVVVVDYFAGHLICKCF